MIESILAYSEARQASFRRKVLEARIRASMSDRETCRLREALDSGVPLVDVLRPCPSWV